ncbi:pre-mRNA-processing factor 6-like [Danaus plexippus]|uniref:pre-mRNA-processing factor 6-like n=1 Tax=Danaus plexippus TaxID=13037 RepID=UPI002AAF6A6B|nr:pre-mRNA-processing factor 6-like [Danaus plexippus]
MQGSVNSLSGTYTSFNSYRTPLSGANTPSLNDLGEARGTVLSVKLDKVMDNVTGQTVIDPKGYLTNLNTLAVTSNTNVADIKKARLLLRSVIQTNPNHAPGWIAAARLEEFGGKIQAARDIIAQGCLQCNKVDDVWLEAARLEKPTEAQAVLARGLKELPQSVKLWLEAAHREDNPKLRKLILRKALQFVPNSVRLWKEAISMEPPEQARVMLSRAVECVPQSVEMWLALSKLSTYQTAQVNIIILRAVNNLTSKGVGLDRDVWIKFAEDCEKSNYPITCQAIVKSTMDIGVEDVNCLKIWFSDAEAVFKRNRIVTARALYSNIVEKMPTVETAWIELANLERQHGSLESLNQCLKNAVIACPTSETLWLMSAEVELSRNNVNEARLILAEAFIQLPDKEKISLAAVKLERENGEYERARVLLSQSRIRCNNSVDMWIQSIQLERLLKNYFTAQDLCKQAINLYPDCSKLWLISGQIYLEQDHKDYVAAMEQFEKGRIYCKENPYLWTCAAEIFILQKNWSIARALLEDARMKLPKNEFIWFASVKLELLAVNISDYDFERGKINYSHTQAAHHMISKALQECPKSGLLWSIAIFLEPQNAQNSKSVVALTQCENDAYIILSVAK